MMCALLGLFIFFFVPSRAHADEATARLGGGNALARAIAGQSQGIAHANPASDLLAHLTFASTRGGRPDEVPPANGNQGNNDGAETGGNTAAGGEGVQGSNPSTPSTGSGQASSEQAGSGSSNNGGASSGNGGDGGSASPGGLVRAGNVVSNATALNMLNVNIVRISSR